MDADSLKRRASKLTRQRGEYVHPMCRYGFDARLLLAYAERGELPDDPEAAAQVRHLHDFYTARGWTGKGGWPELRELLQAQFDADLLGTEGPPIVRRDDGPPPPLSLA